MGVWQIWLAIGERWWNIQKESIQIIAAAREPKSSTTAPPPRASRKRKQPDHHHAGDGQLDAAIAASAADRVRELERENKVLMKG